MFTPEDAEVLRRSHLVTQVLALLNSWWNDPDGIFLEEAIARLDKELNSAPAGSAPASAVPEQVTIKHIVNYSKELKLQLSWDIKRLSSGLVIGTSTTPNPFHRTYHAVMYPEREPTLDVYDVDGQRIGYFRYKEGVTADPDEYLYRAVLDDFLDSLADNS